MGETETILQMPVTTEEVSNRYLTWRIFKLIPKIPCPMCRTRFVLNSFFYSKIITPSQYAPMQVYNLPKKNQLLWNNSHHYTHEGHIFHFIMTSLMKFHGYLRQIYSHNQIFIKICFYFEYLTIKVQERDIYRLRRTSIIYQSIYRMFRLKSLHFTIFT